MLPVCFQKCSNLSDICKTKCVEHTGFKNCSLVFEECKTICVQLICFRHNSFITEICKPLNFEDNSSQNEADQASFHVCIRWMPACVYSWAMSIYFTRVCGWFPGTVDGLAGTFRSMVRYTKICRMRARSTSEFHLDSLHKQTLYGNTHQSWDRKTTIRLFGVIWGPKLFLRWNRVRPQWTIFRLQTSGDRVIGPHL